MKFYILSILLFLFSCSQKPATDNEKSYFTEGQKTEDKKEVKKYDFLSYTNSQLDSFFQVSRDSLLDFVSKNEFEKDTIISNGFSQVIYGVATNGFPAIVFIENKFCDIGGENFECKSFLYHTKNKNLQLIKIFINQTPSLYDWYGNEIERRDVNFDNKIDIIIKRPWHMVSREIVDYLLVMNSDSNKIKLITSTDRLLTNEKKQRVISFIDGGNCCTHHKIINKWQNDSLVEIKHLEKSYSYQEGKGTLEEFIIKNSKETKVKSQKISFDDAEKYFEKYQ
ncbi:hypothetical protein Fleli_1751 [Bernardetia litoralis DSM 6794]|uniref:Lipoprotein n=1 Tax=Bernardetia litoralis (strain ATCC 23117 / DSM 6794 / NBRC 15988 / NCIMB 1366 / Fx l1 / Sio-4) TaxID=880071 RepID=I4AJL5_BERLS|nr:hypothetical protein [Bernardetia litoralis]AFM04150.1 hypothetical protein Fleli_1751 [Bernardetia litoralis DSM 6794]